MRCVTIARNVIFRDTGGGIMREIEGSNTSEAEPITSFDKAVVSFRSTLYSEKIDYMDVERKLQTLLIVSHGESRILSKTPFTFLRATVSAPNELAMTFFNEIATVASVRGDQSAAHRFTKLAVEHWNATYINRTPPGKPGGGPQ